MHKLITRLLVLAFLIVAFWSVAQPAHAEGASTNMAQQSGVYHTVQWGQTLSQIAVAYGSSVPAIMAANPAIPHPNLIYAGMVLFIPMNGTVVIPPPAPMPPVAPIPSACRYYHTVLFGQTMLSIANWYAVSPFAIAEANQIFNLNRIYAGQVLCIP